ncbi:MAG: Na+/H+ antiporter subunit E [Gammaproteobacteria bacterium]
MKHITGLALVLVIFWLINSGHFDSLLLGLGLVSVVLVMWINQRMTKINDEYQPPVLLSLRLPSYLLWLAWEIVKSNMHVVRRIWQRSPDISPTVFTVRVSQQTDVCKVLYANSIIMTPGTVTLEVEGDEFQVHALTRATAESLQSGEMDARVSRLED